LSTAPAFNGVDPDDLMYTNLDNDPPSSHPPLAVCSYELIDKRRATRFEYDYTFRVEPTNAGATTENVRATVSASSAYSTLLDDQIDFGIAGPGEAVMSA